MSTERLEVVITDTGGRIVRKNVEDIGKAAERSQGSVDLLSRALSGLAAAFSATSIVKMLDTYTNMQNRLKLVTTGTANLAAVTENLLDVSARTRTSFEATATLYARIALATKQLGVGQQQLMKFVEGVNQAVVLSGVGAQEARNAIIQFTQGLAKGRLDGDELRSVLEQIPFVADVIAKSLGVARGELRELGKQGKLTPAVILEAFRQMEGELTTLFAQTLPTFSQAWQVFTDRVMKIIGPLGTQIGQVLAMGLAQMADNFDVVTAAVVGLGSALSVLAFGGLISALTWILRFAAANPFTIITMGIVGAVTAFGQLEGEADKVIKSMGRTVTALDKLMATFGAVRAYAEAAWADFPEWFAGMMERAVNLAVAQWAKLADKLRGAIKGVGESIDSAIGDGKGKLFTNMFADIADQFKSSGELQQQVDFASDYIMRYPDAVKRAGDAAAEAYNDILLQRSKALGELSSGDPLNIAGKGKPLTDKQLARLVPKTTLNDALIDLQKQIELIGMETSERERLNEVMKVEDQIRNSIADREARRKFALDPAEVQQINDMVAALQRLKIEAEVLDEIRQPQVDIMARMSALTKLFQNQTISLDEYNKKFLELQISLLEFNETMEGGIIRGVLKLQQEFTNLSTLTENLVVDSIHSAEDAFVQFVKTGKFEFKDLIDSMIEDIARLAIRQSISGPLVQALGGVIGGLFNNITVSSNYTQGGVATSGIGEGGSLGSWASGPAFATGGDMTVGGTGGIDSQMVNFRATPGEKIYVRKPGEREPGDGGATVAVRVNVINNGADVQVNQRQGEDGTPEIDVLVNQIEDQLAANVRKGQGALLPAMSEKLGVSSKPINR